jgi:L-asparaginase II
VSDSVVEVWRGPIVESRHKVNIAVVDGEGRLRAFAGDPEMVTFARSAIKPMQALPLVEDEVADRYEFTEAELALACASHNGEQRHVELARSMLRKIGADESALACGAHAPLGKRAATALAETGGKFSRIHNNCSGKHAGMLALARFYSWPLVGYQLAEHPVQQRMLTEMARWTDMAAEDIPLGVDGCAVVTFGLPLARMARAFAGFASAARRGDKGPARVVEAMTKNPECVAGVDRLCTDLMRAVRGRIFVKVGAEGVYCAGVPGAELGIALKIDDGATRAAEPALIATLKELTLLTDEELAMLEHYAEPETLNTRGEVVGQIRARVELVAA